MTTSRRGASLVAPALLLPAAAIMVLAQKLPSSLAAAMDAAPLIVFGSGALLGLVTRRGRLVGGVVVLALADCALVNLGGRTVFDTVALLLPLNLAVVIWLGESNLFAGRAAALFAIVLLQAAAVVGLGYPRLAAVASLDEPLVGAGPVTWTALPPLSVLAFAAALGLVLARFFLSRHALAANAAWALVASFLALDGASSGGPANAHMAAAGLLLLVGATREPRHIALLDDITRLPTRPEFQRALRRLPRRWSVAYVEIDDFANFRETHGPQPSRRMLRLIARRLAKAGRAFYCEGHTFAVLFAHTSLRKALRRIETVRKRIEDVTVEVSLDVTSPDTKKPSGYVLERTVSVTISAGVAGTTARGTDPKDVLEAAAHALERARQAGMNCVSR